MTSGWLLGGVKFNSQGMIGSVLGDGLDGLLPYWFVRWFYVNVFVDGPIGRMPGFYKRACLTGFGVADDFGFVPVETVCCWFDCQSGTSSHAV